MTPHLRFGRTSFLLLGLSLSLLAAAQRTCGSMEYLQQQIATDPDRGASLEGIESFTNQWIAEHGAEDRAVVTIPVVFHVVYANSAQNISDAKIQAQIAQLNADYARLNSDANQTPSIFTGVAANTEVQFCLAQRDPSGAATTGIVRRSTSTSSFSDNDGVKYTSSGGSNAWPRDSYLNIWSCNLGGGLLGYAQFPGGAAATDGVVILYSSVGSLTNPGTASPYHLGRTLTHEVGHWLNLRHIWGDANCGSDLVSDTPTHNTSNFGCPTYPHYSTCSGTPVEMTSNYMDYTDDGCMNIFTAGQKTRMQALFGAGGSRVSLATSLGCVPPSGGTCAVPSGLGSSSVTSSSATVSWGAASGAVSYNLQYKTSAASTWTTVNTTATSHGLSGLASSTTYNYQVQTVCSASSSAFSAASSFTTSAAGGTCNAPSGLAASAITSTTATVSWATVSGATGYNLQYKLASSGTWTTYNTTGTAVNFTGLTANTSYNAQVQAVCSGGNSAYSNAITFTTTGAACSDTWESNNSSNTAKTISVNTDISALISSTTDNDWFKFNNTSSQRRIRINLTNLAGDYDVRLYRGTSTQVGISQNGGTTAEQIIYNTSTVATYYIRVYGYNGAYSTTQCYNLRANISASNWREGQFDEEVALDAAEEEGLMGLYPNPASNKVMLDYLASGEGTVQIQFIDAMGRQVLNMQQSVVEGPATYGLPLPPLSDGMYVVNIIDGDRRYQQRLLIEQ
ncbi:MAG: fibronectin type III domain-containing protein [Flavobacteriales bacterium]|nr:fibronectin type III domain-containing protein [Flavobacteriales bacterium]